MSKILERAVHDQLYKYLTSHNILSQCQSGFRSKHSTNTALLDVTDYILLNANDGKVTASIFLDLKKAFDTVNHDLLLKKLNSYGIKGTTLAWFKSYLSDRTQAVNINSTLSDFKNIEIGVPQGSILGPLLFIIFVNSLPDSIHNDCKCVMYADDTTLLLNSSDPTTLQNDLNSNLDKIADWFKANKLTLNIKKTKLMLFGTKKSLCKFKDVSLKYDGITIERVEKFKYLGVSFDPQLSWNEHVNYLSSIISKRIGVICRIKQYLPNKIINMLAQALIFPHFDYCSSVWSNFSMQHSNELQILQNRLARVLLSADIRTSVDKMLKDLDWVRLAYRWEHHLLIQAFKCLKELAPTYMSSVFTFTHSVHSKCTRSQSHYTLVIPNWKTNFGKKTFHYRATKLWNKLPPNIRVNFNKMSVNQFKNAINL